MREDQNRAISVLKKCIENSQKIQAKKSALLLLPPGRCKLNDSLDMCSLHMRKDQYCASSVFSEVKNVAKTP